MEGYLLAQLSYRDKERLCHILDQNDKWQELGAVYMGYSVEELNSMKKVSLTGGSPSDKLLTSWSLHGHIVLELFTLFVCMKLNEAMNVLKEYVDEEYHCLIQTEDNMNVSTEVVKDNEKTEKGDFIDSVAQSATGVPSIPYEELFNGQLELLGRGGFGQVFKGTWKHTEVAVKRLDQKKGTLDYIELQTEQAIIEINSLNFYRHDNILPLFGYSVDGPYPCLVYQYMHGGALDVRLRNNKKLLSWPKRLDIAIGVARGLQFLHTNKKDDKPLVHGDIKSANILLDRHDVPRIGDFGLAREGPNSQFSCRVLSKIFGTAAYLPLDYLHGKELSVKIDTYSFGVVLFEIATAKPAMYKSAKTDSIVLLTEKVLCHTGDILELKDKRVEGFDECFLGLMRVGKTCARQSRKERPTMVEVLMRLEELQSNQ